MLSYESESALRRLAVAVMDVRPLVDVLEQPVVVALELNEDLLNWVAGRVGAPRFKVLAEEAGSQLSPFGRVVSDRLRQAAQALAGAELPEDLAAADTAVDEEYAASFEVRYPHTEVAAPDGVRLRAFAMGTPSHEAVLVSAACGMPARLCQPWLEHLAREHFVLTHETRGLFGQDVHGFTGATDVQTQANDLVAILDHFGVNKAHIVGLCGGAVVGLAAAAEHPDRIASLSLWHGDYELGEECAKTDHQRDLAELLSMTASKRVSAEAMYSVITRSMLRSSPPDLAHLVLYPYATPTLLQRYCELNSAIMELDVRRLLNGAGGYRTLVVTSEDDSTAHPDGSRYVAAAIGDARLHVAKHGDHLSLFQSQPALLQLAASFIAEEV